MSFLLWRHFWLSLEALLNLQKCRYVSFAKFVKFNLVKFYSGPIIFLSGFLPKLFVRIAKRILSYDISLFFLKFIKTLWAAIEDCHRYCIGFWPPNSFLTLNSCFSTPNCIQIDLNWKLRQYVIVEETIGKVLCMNSHGGKKCLIDLYKMYKNI